MEVGKKMVNMFGDQKNFEETELRLGLPGGGGGATYNGNGKRGFDETVDLKLNLASKEMGGAAATKGSAVANSCLDLVEERNHFPKDPVKPPPAKAQVVGWPPVRSYRKNILAVQKNGTTTTARDEEISTPHDKVTGGGSGNTFVKVSMDGAPYLRKVDLKMYKSYQDLSDALGNMFSSFTIGNCGSQGMKDFMNESKLMDLLNNSDYVPTYEDKDGDWMLVGDVPWEMFVNSCKRLRIMKGTEAIGLAPRAMEKYKNRS